MKESPAYFAIIPANVRYDKELSPNAKLLFGEITALCNQNGYCWAGNEYFANLYGISKVSISRLISQLKDKNYIFVEMNYREGTKEILNRHIKLANDPINNIVNTYNQKCKEPINKNVKDNNTYNNTYNNIEQPQNVPDKKINIQDRFEKLWAIYPKGRKKGKELALKSYKRAIKSGTTDEQIAKGIEDYKQEIKALKTELQFIKQGGTWFYNKCWNDDYETVKKSATDLENTFIPEEWRT